ncbi:MAG: ribonuclease P protein component [Rhabdochlamydiaceae bacterium]|nr:ribonuclease P protein component [Rhabdochlamydiaceae bacterium]
MWIPQKNENSQRTAHSKPQKKNRKKEAYHRVGLSFPKALRLLFRGQFQRISKEGKRFAGKTIYFQYQEGAPLYADRTRLGITVSRKYGKAHDRNRFKRVVREAFRESYDRIPKGLSLHIMPRLPRSEVCKQTILSEIQDLLKHLSC